MNFATSVQPFRFGMHQNSVIAQFGFKESSKVYKTGAMSKNINCCIKTYLSQLTKQNRVHKIVLKTFIGSQEQFLNSTIVHTRYDLSFYNSSSERVGGF